MDQILPYFSDSYYSNHAEVSSHTAMMGLKRASTGRETIQNEPTDCLRHGSNGTFLPDNAVQLYNVANPKPVPGLVIVFPFSISLQFSVGC